MQLRFIIILIIAIFVSIFALQNGGSVTIDLFLAEFDIPLALLIMVCIIIGAIIVLLLGTIRQLKKGSQIKELKNKIKVMETEKNQYTDNIDTMQTEIITLKDTISSLEEKTKLQEEMIEKFNNEIELNKAIETEETEEIEETKETEEIDKDAGLEVNDEKSKVNNE